MSSLDAVPSSLLRIRRVSRVMAGLSLGIAALILVLDALIWLDQAALEEGARDILPPRDIPFELTPLALTGGFVLMHLVVGLLVYALWQAFRLFGAFARGDVFTPEAGDRLRRIGTAFALVPFAQVLGTGATSFLITMNNPEGQRVFAITFDPAHLILGLAGGLVLVVGWVMAEAARLSSDLEQIV
jgi:hypothetical protein